MPRCVMPRSVMLRCGSSMLRCGMLRRGMLRSHGLSMGRCAVRHVVHRLPRLESLVRLDDTRVHVHISYHSISSSR